MKKPALGPSISYVEVLDYYTLEKEKEKQLSSEKFRPIRPSAIGRCGRQLAYDYAKYLELDGYKDYPGEDKEGHVVRLLSLGHKIEDALFRDFDWKIPDEKLKRRFTQQYLRFDCQFPDGDYLGGSIDGVFITPNNKALVDVKSKKEKFSSHSKSSWEEMAPKLGKMPGAEVISEYLVYVDDLDLFLDKFRHKDYFMAFNLYQLNLYYHDKDNFIRDLGIDHCSLLYYSKNTSRLFELRFRPSEKVANDRIELVKDIIDKVYNKKDPELVEKELDLGSIGCAFCPWASKCWEGANSLKAYFDTWPKKSWPTNVRDLTDEERALFDDYVEMSRLTEDLPTVEKRLAKSLGDKKIRKVELEDGSVYDVKFLKTQGHVLRKGKK